jgi:hypothetical protein
MISENDKAAKYRAIGMEFIEWNSHGCCPSSFNGVLKINKDDAVCTLITR